MGGVCRGYLAGYGTPIDARIIKITSQEYM